MTHNRFSYVEDILKPLIYVFQIHKQNFYSCKYLDLKDLGVESKDQLNQFDQTTKPKNNVYIPNNIAEIMMDSAQSTERTPPQLGIDPLIV